MQKGFVLSDLRAAVLLGALFLSWESARAAPDLITLIHSSDLHSNLEGISPNADYTPDTPGDDATLGGSARIASFIAAARAKTQHPLFVVDSGDFSGGTMYHALFKSRALELQLLGLSGYDVVTLGEHEFDLGPDGLASALFAVKRLNLRVPQITAANISMWSTHRDHAPLLQLDAAFKAYPVQRSVILSSGKIKIGVFGIMGKVPAAIASRRGVTFLDPVAEARREVDYLRRQSVDLIVCLHHAPLDLDPVYSDSLELARKVPDIDVILGGHTEFLSAKPWVEGQTIIASSGSRGRQLGILRLKKKHGHYVLDDFSVRQMDDAVVSTGDPAPVREIGAILEQASKETQNLLFAPRGFDAHTALASTLFDLPREASGQGALGDLVTDSMRWAVAHAERGSAPGVDAALLVRSDIGAGIRQGTTGRIEARDAFRVVPYGSGSEGEIGEPLITFYLSGLDIKNLIEASCAECPEDTNHALHVSGIRYSLNPNRLTGSKVTGLWLEGPLNTLKPLPMRRQPPLYRTVMTRQDFESLALMIESDALLTRVIPKDRAGRAVAVLDDMRVDGDPEVPGFQELRVWHGFLDFLRSFPDTDGDGIPDIPSRYRTGAGRDRLEASTAPVAISAGGGLSNGLVVFGAMTAVFSVCLLALRLGRTMAINGVLLLRRIRASVRGSSE